MTADRPLIVLVAPDSFKGSLTAVEVARALAAGWARARPRDEILLAPLADGGEGTLVAIEVAGGWTVETATVHDPLGREIQARWLRSLDGTRAVVEMAEASGLSRVAPSERDPVAATSVGTGEVMRIAALAGATRMIVGIGGSATTDGGEGLLRGLAGDEGIDRPPSVAHTIALEVACDVTNPLHGPDGAAAVYGPQKGATPEQVRA
ncbi:MAG TPA: glycerate kinase, partial [Candidatus Limnocylindrales bacterium]